MNTFCTFRFLFKLFFLNDHSKPVSMGSKGLYLHHNILDWSTNASMCSQWHLSENVSYNFWKFLVAGRFVAVGALTDEYKESGEDTAPQHELTGVLLSPVLEYSEWSCLRLVYQIVGSGSLEVLQRTKGKSFDRPLWRSQTTSESWVISSMDLQNNTEPYKVLFAILFY